MNKSRRRNADHDLVLSQARDQLETELAHVPNVLGSMLSAKIIGGQITDEDSVGILVGRKLPSNEFTKNELIPKVVQIQEQKIPTDVVEVDGVIPQARGVSIRQGQRTNDRSQLGTLTAFCRSEFGVFGMSCAHSLGGLDRDISTPNGVLLWSETEERWVTVGTTVFGIKGRGSGRAPQFGFSDAAIFSIDDNEIAERVRQLQRQAIARQIRKRDSVTGRTASRTYTGRIIGFKARFRSMFADFVVRVSAPGTVAGDSGMLWRAANGSAVAIHAFGSVHPGSQRSRYSLCMAAARASNALSVTLLRS